MQIANVPIDALEKMIPLLKEKEKLEKRLSELDEQLGSLQGSAKPETTAKHPTTKKGKRSKRRDLKTEIPELLKKAGKEGLKVGDIAKTLSLPANNIYTWFYTTGRKEKKIKQVNKRYIWAG